MPANVRQALVRAGLGLQTTPDGRLVGTNTAGRFWVDTMDPDDQPAPADNSPAEFFRKLGDGSFDEVDDE